MSSYSITIELPYHINQVIDQLVVAFDDIDFNDWQYDDQPCTLLGYEDGDYPPNDFFRSDKFYVEIDSRRSVRFMFDDTQQHVYTLNGQYVCGYFTTKLANFFPSDYFNERFTILNEYGYQYYETIDDYPDTEHEDRQIELLELQLTNIYNNKHDNLDDLYDFMDEIEIHNAIAINEYSIFKQFISDPTF